jgi:hypothetical protein
MFHLAKSLLVIKKKVILALNIANAFPPKKAGPLVCHSYPGYASMSSPCLRDDFKCICGLQDVRPFI